MTQEDKELLLKDLCARLPYGVKVEITHWRNRDKGMIDSRIFHVPLDINKASVLIKPTSDIRPYLFPLSSMTEEQIYNNPIGFSQMTTILANRDWERITIKHTELCRLIDWFNKNHFDWRGLIPMGLAVDATGKGIY